MKSMGQLENMQIFIKVVETGGITKAAEQLNLAKSAVSKRLGEIEKQLRVKLINRTTRKSSLTEAGNAYYQKCKLILEEVDDLNCLLSSVQQSLNGTLRLTVPLSFGVMHLVNAFELFANQHPQLQMDIDFSDRNVSLVEEGFDLAIRIGHLTDSSMHARAIAPISHLICASPEYLAKHGTPETPEQLKSHKLLRYSRLPLAGIELTDKDKQKITVPMESHCIANNGDFLKAMTVSGHGVTFLPRFIVWQELANGTLKTIMPDYKISPMKAYAIYPQNRYLPKKVRMLIDFLSQHFGDVPYWDQ
ncbi:LysR family transcriptional regulator [Shewanella sp. D64]|uniref:LysR family transcriptional regulator n=1 Tax=unclassified Shewanella TaxID=196818 RepID=UPI0022BA2758|nr:MULTISPECIES: LysR family transcriptional regulator [unclassified Shewanella]MEC4723988.1 LysR family transcriptional regulator [Shewanella sp. D64]MEC4736008.1 LysR family transcriptional regulator [Shewanella sp. E94]WBJ93032.1 LysR family transcriptional regulator [Shewanella sp. MTB7]